PRRRYRRSAAQHPGRTGAGPAAGAARRPRPVPRGADGTGEPRDRRMTDTLASGVIDAREFRNALGAFTTGVTIVTTCDGAGRDVGLTVNSFNSVSLEPPLVLWSLARSSASLAAFVEAPYFAVHILGARQEALSNCFARRGADKFAGLELVRGHGGVPLLDGCAARFEC